MKNPTLNIQIDPNIQAQMQNIAKEMGVSLNSFVNDGLKKIIKITKDNFKNQTKEPSEYLKKELKKSQKDMQNKKVSPTFNNQKDAFDWLDSNKSLELCK